MRIGLWKTRLDDGRTFLSGKNEFVLIPPNAYFSIWPNADKKEGSKSPDYYLTVSEPKEKEREKNAKPEFATDDIPF